MQEVFILKQAKELRQEHKRMGAEKMLFLLSDVLKEHGIKYGRDKFYNLLGEHGLLIKRKGRSKRTTNSNHFYRKYPNLIRDLELTCSGKLWVSDITYIRTAMGFVYLSLITDAHSRKIVGWCLWPDLTSEGALNALKMAVQSEGVKKNELIHHSDRGTQYCCNDYVNYLNYSLDETFKDYLAANEAVKTAVYKYNNKRPHASCNYMTPVEAHSHKGELKKRWTKRVFQSADNFIEMQS